MMRYAMMITGDGKAQFQRPVFFLGFRDDDFLTTPDVDEAIMFSSVAELMMFWQSDKSTQTGLDRMQVSPLELAQP